MGENVIVFIQFAFCEFSLFGNIIEKHIGKGYFMSKRLIIYITFFVFALISCSAPSSNLSSKNKKSAKDKTTNNKITSQKENEKKSPIEPKSKDVVNKEKQTEPTPKNEMLEFGEKPTIVPNRSKDTTFIKLKDLEIKKADLEKVDLPYHNIVVEFEKAIQEFDNENYNKAMQKFSFFKETLMPTDSLYYESVFYISECEISLGNYSSAEEILTILLKTDVFENKTKEKSLLRLGQIKCAINEEKIANDLFKDFKKKYPKSIYLKLANCNALTTNK